jgi:FkbM family methyltransferase
MNRILRKWKFLLLKLVWLKLIKFISPRDFYVKIHKKSTLKKPFVMQTCYFKDQVACNVMKFGWRRYESPMGSLIVGLSQSRAAFFMDIGANTGFYSLLACASGASKVIAYEPIPEIFSLLKENIRLSGMSDLIEIHQEAISNECGLVKIYLPANNQKYIETSASLSQNFRNGQDLGVDIRTISLNSFLSNNWLINYSREKNFLILKIDVESYELPVLMGSDLFLKTYQPIIFIELLNNNPQRLDIYNLIVSMGYKGVSLSEDSFQVVDSIECSHSAHDNYLFVPISIIDQILLIINKVLKENH